MQCQNKVSVLITTYNRELYIVQAIESVLMQKTDFDFEIIIGDDFSTDNTRSILLEYAKKFPDRIKLLFHPHHVGLIANFVATYKMCQRQYIAFLDGDDYWTDPYKLQKQVMFLDNHQDVVICGHWIEIFDQEDGEMIEKHGLKNSKHGPKIIKPYYTIDDMFDQGLLFHISTAMCRNVLPDFPDWFMKLEIENDGTLMMLLEKYGKVGFFDETMSVLRLHKKGTCAGASNLTNLKRGVNALNIIGLNMGLNKRDSFRRCFLRTYIELFNLYVKEGTNKEIILTGYHAVKISPNKKQTVFQLFSILIYNKVPFRFVQRFRLIKVKLLEIIKQLLGIIIYDKIKRVYHHFITP